MGTNGVVVLPPGIDRCGHLPPRTEPLHAQALVSILAVEALVGSVLPRLPWRDVRGFDALCGDPAQDRRGDELRAVVGSKVAWSSSPAHQFCEHLDHGPDLMLPATSIANASRGHSSTTVRHLICWPVADVSNTKSYAQT